MIKYLLIFISISLNAQEFQNITFVKISEKEQDNYKVFNEFSNSMLYGFWTNRYLNYNGTHTLKNAKTSEGIIYQCLRTLSLFDLYLTHSSLGMLGKDSAKIHNISLSTTLESGEIGNYQPFTNQYTKTYAPILNAFTLFAGRLNLKSFNENDIIESENGPAFSKDFSLKIRSKVKDKLDVIWRRVKTFSDSGQIPVEVINDALLPLNTLSEIHLDKNGNNYFQLDILLPGLFDAKKENRRGMPTSNPLEWQIQPGLIKKFSPPLQGLAEALDIMKYLGDAQEGTQWEEIKNKLIHIQIYKNFKDFDKMELSMEFGEVPNENFLEKKEKVNRLSLFPIDISNRKSALKMEGYLGVEKGKTLNKLMNTFKIEAWIHKLSFDLIRDGKFKSWQERFDANPTYKMVYREDKSFLSLRMKKGVKDLKDTFLLKKMGFTCEKFDIFYKKYKVLPLPNFQYTCMADFSNSEEFKSDFIPKFGRELTRNIIGLASAIELKGFLKDLEKINKVDLSEEKKLFEKVFDLLKENKMIFDSLNFLPKEITNFNTK
jgi:hypothetical protein